MTPEKRKLVSVKKLYSLIVDDYEHGARGEMFKMEESVIEKLIPPLRGKKVLDVGCGKGRWTRRFREADVTGLDFSDEMLAAARKSVDAGFIKGDAMKMPFADGEFDFVFSSLMISHMKDWRKAVKEMLRVTRGGGLLGISDIHGSFKPEEGVAPFSTQNGKYYVESYRIFPQEVVDACEGCELLHLKEIPASSKFITMVSGKMRESAMKNPVMFFVLLKKI